ncbi:MAG: hypothetical protein KGO96_09365 [Elusimicrobia bacterium]|nr:hypothetical protein [Elusimicrobiota bacterium]MDE2237042.1 hypothetical protein [Elusimicrobiota bacterium]MDE2426097.1 hypothetical protein [Elusimicrobiota bacterium]
MTQRPKNEKRVPIDSTTGYDDLTDLRRELEQKIKEAHEQAHNCISKSTAKWAIGIFVVVAASAFGYALSFMFHLQSDLATIQTILKIPH